MGKTMEKLNGHWGLGFSVYVDFRGDYPFYGPTFVYRVAQVNFQMTFLSVQSLRSHYINAVSIS